MATQALTGERMQAACRHAGRPARARANLLQLKLFPYNIKIEKIISNIKIDYKHYRTCTAATI